MSNPEQPILDAIDELVEWQMEEGRRRGDGPLHEVEGGYYGLPPSQEFTTDALHDDLRRGALVIDIWEPKCSCCRDRPDVHAENMRRWRGLIDSSFDS